MTSPVLTSELRDKLQDQYNEKKSIAGFLLYNDKHGYLVIDSFRSMGQVYDERYYVAQDLELNIEEDFLVVNTFKEFELETGELT